MDIHNGDFVINDFRFNSGEMLPELNLHYRTLGEPRRDDAGIVRNAVLIMHGTGGSGESLMTDNFSGVLFGPGQVLDAADYYIILPDGIGHGQSSKPSDGLRAQFPQYRYADMLEAQYRLVTEALGVNHLRLVMGTSMGGMQTWMWGQTYPDFMDCLLPLASFPAEIAGRNRMMRKMIIDSIRNDPEWNGGEYETQPHGLIAAVHILLVMSSIPLQWQNEAPTADEADQMLQERVQARLERLDANDFLYQMSASRDYNPAPGLSKIKAPLLAINSADDQVNPPELRLMVEGIGQVEQGEFVLLPISEETRGHGTHSWPVLWQHHLATLLNKSKPR